MEDILPHTTYFTSRRKATRNQTLQPRLSLRLLIHLHLHPRHIPPLVLLRLLHLFRLRTRLWYIEIRSVASVRAEESPEGAVTFDCEGLEGIGLAIDGEQAMCCARSDAVGVCFEVVLLDEAWCK